MLNPQCLLCLVLVSNYIGKTIDQKKERFSTIRISSQSCHDIAIGQMCYANYVNLIFSFRLQNVIMT